MEFMLDTADLAAIEYWNDHLQLSGITTNPTILKKAAAVDVFDRLRAIRKTIGTAKCLCQSGHFCRGCRLCPGLAGPAPRKARI